MAAEPDTDELERIDDNVNGLYTLVASLKDRVAELEEENAELRAEIETIKSWQATEGDDESE